jgi:DNA-binding transcriptional ArsR family regulator
MTYSAAAVALDALSDPTRRAVFERVARAPAAVGEIAREMPVSRPAVSQHLRVLKEARLVSETAEGTRRIYRLDPRGLGALRSWLDQFWADALSDFKSFVEANADGRDDEETAR